MKVSLPFVGMVMAECAQVGLIIVSKAVMSKGMSSFIFICYSNALASLILLLSSLLFHRSQRPPLTFSIVCGFFLLGLFGFLAQLFGYTGINLSSPTLGTAMLNLVPGFTFVLAVAFRMEKVDWRTFTTLAKSMGTIVSIGGAFILTYYKGPPIWMTRFPLNSSPQLFVQLSNWVIGGLLLAVDCVMTSAWIIIQGVFGSAFQVGIVTWCLQQTGPVFVSMFKPLGIVIAAVAGVIFLGDTLYLGSMVGAIVIVIGFYAVMWGKAKEWEIGVDAGVRSFESSSQKVPLLQSYIQENTSVVQ
ncbi:WAT1-related protein At3g28050 isoform X2 [Hevea brasiliensis]|uniref:WAT1-related protein At3g28050 isoform X2 n=1 Tax=Hevea brasiliensis TaxID=3981 RepID=UPI0025E73DB5|nr:WAT1-related protein At3g28050 isoform X2 [Hevea brasiliensis]